VVRKGRVSAGESACIPRILSRSGVLTQAPGYRTGGSRQRNMGYRIGSDARFCMPSVLHNEEAYDLRGSCGCDIPSWMSRCSSAVILHTLMISRRLNSIQMLDP
jgi:hypothetical protein